MNEIIMLSILILIMVLIIASSCILISIERQLLEIRADNEVYHKFMLKIKTKRLSDEEKEELIKCIMKDRTYKNEQMD